MGIPVSRRSSGTTVFPKWGDGAPQTGQQVYSALLDYLGARQERRVGAIRWVARNADDSIGVTLHYTEVVRVYPNGRIVLDWGLWHTRLTNDTMDAFLPFGWMVNGHRSLIVRHMTTRPNPDPSAEPWESTLYLHAYYPVPLYSRVTISPRGIVTYAPRYGGKSTRADVTDDWGRAERMARKLNKED